MGSRSVLLITMGDVAGVGPEIIARAWPDLLTLCRPIVVGDPGWLRKALALVGSQAQVQAIDKISDANTSASEIPCLAATSQDLSRIESGKVSAAAGRAAYDFLCKAIELTMAGEAAGIVTAPLHKEGLHAAGLAYPGHTEILAEQTGTRHFAMLLSAGGITVAHVTLHVALRDVFGLLTTEAILEKIRLLDEVLPLEVDSLARRANELPPPARPRIGVAALNPHASDGGLFGDEEERIIRPAVTAAKQAGIEVSGPWPCDTLFVRASKGEFDGIVAMYHDQGHIALKLLGGMNAVNICAGLPIIRTSVAHGTAYDIAGKGIADARSMIEAVRVAAALAARQTMRR